MTGNAGWHPHPQRPDTWAYWDGTRWLSPEESAAAGHAPPPGAPASTLPPPGYWQASDGRWYPPEQHPWLAGTQQLQQVQYVAQQTNGLAIASMVLGILWIWGIGAILALVFGYRARRQIDQSGGRQGGRGMATAGVVLGWIGVAGAILIIVLFTVVAATGGFDDLDDLDSDPPNGVCNPDRFWQDPDCD
jgi:hypothetical protein